MSFGTSDHSTLNKASRVRLVVQMAGKRAIEFIAKLNMLPDTRKVCWMLDLAGFPVNIKIKLGAESKQ